MTREYIIMAELIHKMRIGIISEEEQQRLNRWLAADVANQELFEKLFHKKDLIREYEEYTHVGREQAWSKLERRMAPSWRRIVMKRMSYAAAVLVLFGLGIYFYQYFRGQEDRDHPHPVAQIASGVGTGSAVLHRANGENVLLDSVNMVIAGGGQVQKVQNKLIYQKDSTGGREVWDVLETPNSCEFQVLLADGTKVWLNAHSRLTYPVTFTGEKRVVRLEGEAYFEVQRDEKHPFVVEMNGMKVKVLGTSFNVKSFEQEGRSVATLMSGGIEVSTATEQVTLVPNQQAELLLSGNKLEVRNVDAESYRAWTKGKFVFRREPLKSILNDLARWYDVTMVYEEESCKDMLFSGIMDRYEDVSETLLMIEKTGKVKFDIQGSSVVVKMK